MNRRLLAALTIGATALAVEPARAQGAVDFSAYAAQWVPIIGGIVLPLSGSGSVTLTSSLVGPTYSMIGQASAGGPDYYFGYQGAWWRNNLGAHLNANSGSMRFSLNGFLTNSVSASLNFNPACLGTPGRAPLPSAESLNGGPLADPPPDPCFEYVTFTAFDQYGNTIGSPLFMTAFDHSLGGDTSKQFTITSAQTDIAYFEFAGGLVAVTNVNVAPEPGTFVLAASGLVAVAGLVRRRRRK